MNQLVQFYRNKINENGLKAIEDYFPRIRGNMGIRSTQDYHVAVVFPIPDNAKSLSCEILQVRMYPGHEIEETK